MSVLNQAKGYIETTIEAYGEIPEQGTEEFTEWANEFDATLMDAADRAQYNAFCDWSQDEIDERMKFLAQEGIEVDRTSVALAMFSYYVLTDEAL